jgi:hypothetical protein
MSEKKYLIEIENDIAKITCGFDVWYIQRYGDSTHLYFSNNLEATKTKKCAVYHVGELRRQSFYNELREYLIKPFRQN